MAECLEIVGVADLVAKRVAGELQAQADDPAGEVPAGRWVAWSRSEAFLERDQFVLCERRVLRRLDPQTALHLGA